jgi:MinD superfamily P-loop ATPase
VVTHAILDTPAGFSGKALESVVKVSSSIIVPIQPSPFDLWATKQFLEQLAELKAVTRGKAGVVLIGMRVGHPARWLRYSSMSSWPTRGFRPWRSFDLPNCIPALQP